MSKRWLIALLLMSFSFNLAVIGSIIWLRFNRPPQPPKQDFQRQYMRHHTQEFFGHDEEIKQLRSRFDGCKVTLMQELAKDPVNEVRVSEIIDSSLVSQNALEQKIAQKIIAYRKTMSPEEAKEHFLERAEKMKNRSHQFNHRKYRRRP